MERFFNREHDSILKEVEKSSKGSKVIKTKFFQKFDNNNDSFYSICHNIVKKLQLVPSIKICSRSAPEDYLCILCHNQETHHKRRQYNNCYILCYYPGYDCFSKRNLKNFFKK